MSFTDAAKNEMLDGMTVDAIRLHSGDPGVDGLSNALGAGLSAAAFDAAAGGERDLNSDVQVSGLGASQGVTHFSVWETSGSVFKGGFAIGSGDAAANAAGEYILKAATKLRLSDPA